MINQYSMNILDEFKNINSITISTEDPSPLTDSIVTTDAQYISIVLLLSLMIGIFQFIIWLLGVGVILAKLLPDSLLGGFMSSAGIVVATSQVKYILGVKVPAESGMLSLIKSIVGTVIRIPNTNLAALLVSLSSFIALLGFGSAEIYIKSLLRRRKERQFTILKKQDEETQYVHNDHDREQEQEETQQESNLQSVVQQQTQNLPTTTQQTIKESGKKSETRSTQSSSTKPPGSILDVILTVLLFALVSFLWNFQSTFKLKIIGHIPSGLPSPQIPWTILDSLPSPNTYFTFLLSFIPGAISISLVCFVTTYSITKSFGVLSISTDTESSTQPQKLVNQDLLILSIASIAGSFFLSHVPSASLSRSALLHYQTDAKTPLTSLFSVSTVILVLLALGPVFESVPMATLAVIVVTSLAGVFKRARLGPDLFHKFFSKVKEVLGDTTSSSPETRSSISSSTARPRSVSERPRVRVMKRLYEHRKELILEFEDVAIWWFTFLGSILTDTGTGILGGIGVVLLFKAIRWHYFV
jgi:MFS superfamily sulfate permease-like transporter